MPLLHRIWQLLEFRDFEQGTPVSFDESRAAKAGCLALRLGRRSLARRSDFGAKVWIPHLLSMESRLLPVCRRLPGDCTLTSGSTEV